MSFNESVENIRVDDNHILRADKDGQTIELDLDTILGNDNGHFQWGGSSTFSSFLSLASCQACFKTQLANILPCIDYSQSAENVTFSVEGGANVPVLRAKLGGGEGADVNLAERIAFEDGKLVFSMLASRNCQLNAEANTLYRRVNSNSTEFSNTSLKALTMAMA